MIAFHPDIFKTDPHICLGMNNIYLIHSFFRMVLKWLHCRLFAFPPHSNERILHWRYYILCLFTWSFSRSNATPKNLPPRAKKQKNKWPLIALWNQCFKKQVNIYVKGTNSIHFKRGRRIRMVINDVLFLLTKSTNCMCKSFLKATIAKTNYEINTPELWGTSIFQTSQKMKFVCLFLSKSISLNNR